MKITLEVILSNGRTFKGQEVEITEERLVELKRIFAELTKLSSVSVELRPGVIMYFNPRHVAAITIDDGAVSETF